MIFPLEWYGAAIQYENTESYSITWAYLEIKATSEAHARAKLAILIRPGTKIIYCQLV